MPDWSVWQEVGRIASDWPGKVGLGGIAGWFLQRWIGGRDKLADRGQHLVDEARPDLMPTGGTGTQHAVSFNVRNDGKGTAFLRRLEMTGVAPVECVGQLPPGKLAGTPQLHVQGAPLYDPAQSGQAAVTLSYADRFDNEYQLTVPVTRTPRADGGFNPAIDWQNFKTIGPTLSKARLRRIAKS